jgi:uncharacterized protein
MIALALLLSAAAPSFDCARANGVERTVCAEPRLAALDVRLAARYAAALKDAPADADWTRTAQRAWLHARDSACGKLREPAPCLDGYYRNRIDTLAQEKRLRDETAGHAPASVRYADFVGRWRVVGVTAAEDAGRITNFGTDDPSLMGLVLEARPDDVRWLNGTDENMTTEVCRGPSFRSRTVKSYLPSGWKAVTLTCRDGNWWKEGPPAMTLEAADLAELETGDQALLHLRRMAPGAQVPSPYRRPDFKLPPGASPEQAAADERRTAAEDKAFLLRLQAAFRRNDREWLAAQGDVTVNRSDGASHTYRPDEIREVYDWIVTPDVRRAVLAQDPEQLFRNWQGAMVGDGQVWFDEVWDGKRLTYEIIAINQMHPEAVTPTSGGPSAGR